MKIPFVEQNQIQCVIDEINSLYNHMISSARVDTSDMIAQMEPIFTQTGYRAEFKNKPKFVKHIAILHDAGTGDFIIMSAVIREIRRTYPNAHIILIINRFALDMAFCCPYVDEILTLKDEVLVKVQDFFTYFKKIPDLVRPLLRHRIDIFFNFGHYPSSQLLAYFSGAKERVDIGFMGADFSFDELTTFRVDWRGFKGAHYNDRFLYILKNFSKSQITNKSLELWLSPVDAATAADVLQDVSSEKLYAICPGGNVKLASKRWPAQNYAELMNLILSKGSATFVIFGGPEDVEASKVIQSSVDAKRIINLTDKLNYRQSAAILKFCDYYIGNDTGLMHAAAALNIPILSPNCFPADVNMTVSCLPALYYPYHVPSVIVQPKHALDKCKGSKLAIGCKSDKPHCITQITPENMLQGLNSLNKQILSGAKEPLFI